MSEESEALTFKAGRVEYDETTKQATPLAGPGQVIVQRKPDDPLFCSLTWERRAPKGKSQALGTSAPEEEFEELLLFPGDAEWNHVKECTTGRVFELKFKSSGQRHVFWMQAPTSDSTNISALSNEDKTIAEQMKQFLDEEGAAAAEDEEMDDADQDPQSESAAAPRSTTTTATPAAGASSESLSQVYELIQNVRRNRDRLRQDPASSTTNSLDNSSQVPILSITDAISNTDMANYVSSLPDHALTPLYDLIPAELPKTRTELVKIIQSPQFLQSLSSFDSVLSQPGAGSVVASQLGYSYQGEGVQGFLDGVRHASKSDQSSRDHNNSDK